MPSKGNSKTVLYLLKGKASLRGKKCPQSPGVPGFPAEWVKEMTELHLRLLKEWMGLGFFFHDLVVAK